MPTPLAAAPDDYPGGPGPTGPAEDFAAVTPSDSVALPFRCRRLWVGGAGAVSLVAKDGLTAVLYSAVPAGSYLNVRASYVRATGTTATLIVAER